MKGFAVFLIALCWGSSMLAQTGVSVSPPRLYFESDAGKSSRQKVTVTNVSATHVMNLALSTGDWQYSEMGENMMYPADSLETSCAGWVNISKEDSYFSLKPGENKEVEVNITVPNTFQGNLSAHTAMLYVTQMNPVDDVDSKGANIKVSIRSGIKLFHRTSEIQNRKLEIENILFDKKSNHVVLYFSNNGNIWADGIVYPELLNTATGKKTVLDHIVFYTMPADKRKMLISLPENLEKGKYTANILIDYGDENTIEMGELSFTND
ncbi:fimbrial biogenesis chaperone [Paenimyroides baculatum]|uniref:Molecular chaperone n=1 Tax=Paenimyroides baculatum TaxID=2608000 RepID=A0A5M6CN04_9FLAO|nr:molecular chaperone [Paenimyroides baculatum]KAA5535362.1 molecular chaperone [Paenimyroides baculatum]